MRLIVPAFDTVFNSVCVDDVNTPFALLVRFVIVDCEPAPSTFIVLLFVTVSNEVIPPKVTNPAFVKSDIWVVPLVAIVADSSLLLIDELILLSVMFIVAELSTVFFEWSLSVRFTTTLVKSIEPLMFSIALLLFVNTTLFNVVLAFSLFEYSAVVPFSIVMFLASNVVLLFKTKPECCFVESSLF